MTTITLDRVPRIVQGAGALGTIGAVVADLVPSGSAVLLVADPGLRGTGMIDTARAALVQAGLGVALFEDVKSDPTMAQVDAAGEQARREKAMAVVSLGGGSALDVGKTVAAICGASPGASHYALCANAFPKSTVVNLCVPTTSGTGSETTRTAVLADAEHAKIWLWGEEIKAVIEPAEGAPEAAELEAQLRAFAEKNLASYKRPKSYDFIAEMPRDPNGKLYKRRLREPYWEGRAL